MKIFKKKPKEQKSFEKPILKFTNKQKLDNILTGAIILLNHGDKEDYNFDLHPVFTYIKMFTDKISTAYAIETSALPPKTDNNISVYHLSNLLLSHNIMLKYDLSENKIECEYKNEITIKLSDCPILNLHGEKNG